MNRFSSAVAAAACSSFLVSGVAFADNNTNHSGSFGLKGSQMDSHGGPAMGALGFAYGISSAMVITANLAYWSTSNKQTVSGNETDSHTSNMGLGAEFDYKVVKGADACTYLNVGFQMVNANSGVNVNGTDAGVKNSDLRLGLGLKGEWSPVKKLSFTTGVGLTMSPNGEGDQAGTAYGGTTAASTVEYGGMDMGINADVLGNAAVTYWF